MPLLPSCVCVCVFVYACMYGFGSSSLFVFFCVCDRFLSPFCITRYNLPLGLHVFKPSDVD
ncbi:hypothetical protein LINGRAHAP2_LOCUS31616 [Linum grandiflorum]